MKQNKNMKVFSDIVVVVILNLIVCILCNAHSDSAATTTSPSDALRTRMGRWMPVEKSNSERELKKRKKTKEGNVLQFEPLLRSSKQEASQAGPIEAERSNDKELLEQDVAHIKTRLGGLCEAFRNVLILKDLHHSDPGGSKVSTTKGNKRTKRMPTEVIQKEKEESVAEDIDVPSLIKACYECEQSMRETGQAQIAKDLFQNTRKVETFTKSVPVEVRQRMSTLLQYEKSSGIHPYNDPNKLKDPSIAMSLLWMRRHITFQYELFRLLLLEEQQPNRQQHSNFDSNNKHHPTILETTLQTYDNILEPYHGWAVQKIFKTAIKLTATSSHKHFFAKIGGFNYADEDKDNNKKNEKNIAVDSSSEESNGDQTTNQTPVEVSKVDKRSLKKRKEVGMKESASKVAATMTPHGGGGGGDDTQAWFGPNEELATVRDMKELVQIWGPLIRQWTKIFNELDLDDYRKA